MFQKPHGLPMIVALPRLTQGRVIPMTGDGIVNLVDILCLRNGGRSSQSSHLSMVQVRMMKFPAVTSSFRSRVGYDNQHGMGIESGLQHRPVQTIRGLSVLLEPGKTMAWLGMLVRTPLIDEPGKLQFCQ